MAEYRVYPMGKNGHIAGPADVVIAEDDAAALKEARQLLGRNDVEVWQGTRLVGVVKHKN